MDLDAQWKEQDYGRLRNPTDGSSVISVRADLSCLCLGTIETSVVDDGQFCGTKGQSKLVESVWINYAGASRTSSRVRLEVILR